MKVPPLKSLKIEHLRGSTQPFTLGFESGKKLTVVYGENGTGKSTICDAFEFLGKGTVGSLENRGLGQTARYWCSFGKKTSDISVTLETSISISRAMCARSGVVVDPPGSQPLVEVLRRTQILSVIEAPASERYNAIKRFINVSGIEASEAALRQSVKDLSQLSNTAATRIQENEESIQNFWNAAGKPDEDAFNWARSEINRDPGLANEEIVVIEKLDTAYGRLIGLPARLRGAANEVESATKCVESAQDTLAKTVQSVAEGAAEVVGILNSAQAYLEKHPTPASCPLCESKEKVADLSKRISERLKAFESLRTVQSQKTGYERALRTAQDQLEAIRKIVIQDIEAFEKIRNETKWPSDLPMPESPAPSDPFMLEDWLNSTSSLKAQWGAASYARQEKKQFVDTLKLAVKTHTENVRAAKEIQSQIPQLETALKIVEEERKTFTDEALAKISDGVGRMYEAVHPGEGLNKISLELHPTRRASLEMGASFCGQTGTPPQAYFSESHLDTLGLCVFLALASLDVPETKILVLDDILASVDEPHVERLIEMLYAEAIKFRHCIITTHYRPWKQKLRWGWLKNGQCQFIELSKWTDQHGMTLIRSVPDVERLRLLLAETPQDPQLVCAKAGVILEAALDFLTQLYQCSVPRRPGGLYTLGDLLPSIDKKLRNALLVEVQEFDASGAASYKAKSLTPILDELIRIAQARNVFGCHFNALSFELLDSDAIAFGQKVLELIETLADPEAGWPRNDKSGAYWANSGETRRLHPLMKPN